MHQTPKSHLEIIQSKIDTAETIQFKLAAWRLKNNKIVFTNGCFDILHLGHIDYLSKAKDLGHVLIVGVNSDDSVKRLKKGPARPLNNEQSRAQIIAALHVVDAVVIFNEDTPLELIKTILPDVLVKGADYKPEQIAGHDVVKANGGTIITVDLLPGYSTTSIEKKIKES